MVDRHPLARQRSRREPDEEQEAHQRPRRGQGRERDPHAADPAHARIRGGVHRGRRAGGSDAEVDPPPQALAARSTSASAPRATRKPPSQAAFSPRGWAAATAGSNPWAPACAGATTQYRAFIQFRIRSNRFFVAFEYLPGRRLRTRCRACRRGWRPRSRRSPCRRWPPCRRTSRRRG